MGNKKKKDPFWTYKTLKEMDPHEWESLCDGCGICCLDKIQDVDTGEIEITSVTCPFLDIKDCRCLIYEDRIDANPECLALSPENIKELTWLPESCAYRCIVEGRDLEWWHHLISGDLNTIHEAGMSVRERTGRGKSEKD